MRGAPAQLKLNALDARVLLKAVRELAAVAQSDAEALTDIEADALTRLNHRLEDLARRFG